MSYQGVLTTLSGSPVADGAHVLTLSIYDDQNSATALYSEVDKVETAHGLFNVIMGSQSPIPNAIQFDKQYFLGLAIDGTPEMKLRTTLTSAPYAMRAQVAETANSLAPGASGLVTSINEVGGHIILTGDSTLSVTNGNRVISLHSNGISSIMDTDNTMMISGIKGPLTKIGVADNAIITKKIADRAVTPNKINQAGAANGQVLKWNGLTWAPSDDLSGNVNAGTDITITGNTVSVAHPLPLGTFPNSTLRWNGTQWVENTNLTSAASGLTTINNSLYLSGGSAPAELRIYQPIAYGTNYSSFQVGQQNACITYTLPTALPSTLSLLTTDASGQMYWTNNYPLLVPFNQITSGTNQNQILTVGNGTNLSPSGTGIIAANQFVGSGSTSTAVDLATGEIAGILPIANGGTNSGTALANNRLMISASGSIVEFTTGTAGQVLVSSGPTSAPNWTSLALPQSGTLNNSTLRWNSATNQWLENTNVLSTSAGLVTVNNGLDLNGSTSSLQLNGSAGTTGQFLTSAGAGNTPTWTSASILPTGTVTDNTLRWNGTAWVETSNVKSSAAGLVTANAGVNLNGAVSPLLANGSSGTTGQFLSSAGSGVTPSWTTLSGSGNITLTSNAGTLTISETNALPAGTATDNTLRWNGTAWVETSNVTSSSAGLLTVKAGTNLSGAASPLLLNGSAGNNGQFLISGGTGSTPSWITGNLLPNGTATDNTLRWNGTNWVETSNVTSTAPGLVTVNAGVNLNGAGSPLSLNNSAGAAGQFLTSAGVGNTPTWTTGSLLPNGTATDNTLRWNGTNWVETANVKSSAAGLVTVNAGVNLNGAASPIEANGSAGTTGQFLTSGGAGTTPGWSTLTAGSNITLTPGAGTLTINASGGIANGTATDNTLRWNGTAWVETSNVTSSAPGLLTVKAGTNLSGAASPLLLNSSAGTTGQFLTSAGAGTTPTWTTGSLLPNGTATDNTLRWNGTNWVETANVKSSAAGLVTVNAGVNFNGASSPLEANGSSGTNGQFLTSGGTGSTPNWSTLTAGANITLTPGVGTLTIDASGGIANGTAVDNTLRWNGTSWIETANVKSSAAGLVTTNAGINLNGTTSPFEANGSAGTSGQVLTSTGNGLTPTWSTVNILPTGTATDNTLRWNGTSWVETANVKSSAAGLVTANAGVDLNGTTSPLQANGSAGTSGQVLTSAGTGLTPTWSTVNILPSGTANDNTLRWNGTSWVETANVKSSAAGLVTANAGVNLNGVTSPLEANGSAGTTGQFLTSAGTGATPTWSTLTAGSNITLTPGAGTLTIAASGGVPNGTATDNTMRWNGAAWVETANVKSSAAGLVTANAGINLNGTTSPLQANGSAGASGQFLTSAGAGTTPIWSTLTAGSNITLTPGAGTLTIAASGGVANGTATDNTLRWSGAAWVETANITSSAAGLLTVKAGVNHGGASSPLLLNGVAGTSGQFLTSAGAGLTPTWTTGSLLPNGTANDNTLRWNGTNWVETANVKSSTAGLVTVNAGVNLNGATSPLQANGSSGTSGQFLTSGGAGVTPSWSTLTAGSNITLTPGAGTLTIAATGGVANGTATDNTLRWSGAAWVETSNVTSTAAGLLSVKAGVNYSGAVSPVLLNGAAGTTGQFLTSAGAGVTPTWTTGNLLPNGTATDNTIRWNGTNWVETSNVTSTAAGFLTAKAGVNLSGAASPLQLNGAAGTSGQFLTSAGAGATPTWTTGSLLTNGTVTDNTLRWNGTNWVETANITSSAAGLLTVKAGVNHSGATSPLQLNGAAGTAGQFLTSAGAGNTPTWTSGNLLANGSATDNTLRWNGSNWVETSNITSSSAGLLTAKAGISHSGTTSPLLLNGSAGTSGQILLSAGAGNTPTWGTVSGVLTNGTATDNTLRWNGTAWVESSNVTSSSTGFLTAKAGLNLSGTTSPLQVNGSAGTSNYVLTSQGSGNTPAWVDPSTLNTASWKLLGNSGTNPGIGGALNFIGTTDNKSLVFGVNNIEHLRMSATSVGPASTATGVAHFQSVLPGGGSPLTNGMTIETDWPSSATNAGVVVNGLYVNSVLDNSFVYGYFCGNNSSLFVRGTSQTTIVRALDGIMNLDNVHSGVVHADADGVFGSVTILSSTTSNTITAGSALRANIGIFSPSSSITTANGLYVENPGLFGGTATTAIGTFNGVYIENLTNATTKRAILYDGSGGNQPFAVTDAGKVGIGRVDPTQALEIRNGNLLLSNNNNTSAEFRIAEPSSSGSNYTAFKAVAQAANITYTLPASLPNAAASGSDLGSGHMESDNNGTLTWRQTTVVSSTLDFPNTAAQSSSDLNVAVTGAADGDIVSIGVPNGSVNANSCYTAWVSGADNVKVRFNNYSAAAINPASGTFKVKVTK